jgi:hypothetical protein
MADPARCCVDIRFQFTEAAVAEKIEISSFVLRSNLDDPVIAGKVIDIREVDYGVVCHDPETGIRVTDLPNSWWESLRWQTDTGSIHGSTVNIKTPNDCINAATRGVGMVQVGLFGIVEATAADFGVTCTTGITFDSSGVKLFDAAGLLITNVSITYTAPQNPEKTGIIHLFKIDFVTDNICSDPNACNNGASGACIYPPTVSGPTAIVTNEYPNNVHINLNSYVSGDIGVLSYSIAPGTGPSYGSLAQRVGYGPGNYTYSPNSDAMTTALDQGIARDGFTWTVTDSSTCVSTEAIVTIIINAVPPSSIPGCMDPSACNYNDLATEDDGSCIDPPGINLDSAATSDIHPGKGEIELSQLLTGATENMVYTIVSDPSFGTLVAGQKPGDFTYNPTEKAVSEGGGWDTFTWAVSDSTTGCGSAVGTVTIAIQSLTVNGCKDAGACNYNSLATADDGSCIYAPILNNHTISVVNNVATELNLYSLIGTPGSGDSYDVYNVTQVPLAGGIVQSGIGSEGPILTYTPTAQYIGTDTIKWTLGNTSENCISAEASINITVGSGTVTTTKIIKYSFDAGPITGFEFQVEGVPSYTINVSGQEASNFDQVTMVMSDGVTKGVLAVDIGGTQDEIVSASGNLIELVYQEAYLGEKTIVISNPTFEGPGAVNFGSISQTEQAAGVTFVLTAPQDCMGAPFGTSVIDECGTCGGTGPAAGYNCDGTLIGGTPSSSGEFTWAVDPDLSKGTGSVNNANITCSRIESFALNSAHMHLVNEIEKQLPNIRNNLDFTGVMLDSGNMLADGTTQYFEDTTEGKRNLADFERSINDIAYRQVSWKLSIPSYGLSWGHVARTAKERSSLTLTSDISRSTPGMTHGGKGIIDTTADNVNGFKQLLEEYTTGDKATSRPVCT